ncbi:MAG: hypothetical protein IJ157_08930 [Clostridia bacterium]|nr:hypothetical protein [Clostridia bacterium]
MPAFHALVNKYKKRRHDTLVDAVTAGLSLADNVSADLGLLEDTGIAAETLETVSSVLPFSVIAVDEGCRVLMGKKTGVAATSDAAFRMIKTGAAMGVGAAVIAAGATTAAALPAAIGSRLLLDRYRGKALTGHRVHLRTQRLRAIRATHDGKLAAPDVTVLEE